MAVARGREAPGLAGGSAAEGWEGVRGAERGGQHPPAAPSGGRKPSPGRQERLREHEAFGLKADIATWDGNGDVLINGAVSTGDHFYFLEGSGKWAETGSFISQQTSRLQ